MTPQEQQTLQGIVTVANGYNTKVWVTEPNGDMSSLIANGLNNVQRGNITPESLTTLALETCHQISLLSGSVRVENNIAVLDLGGFNFAKEGLSERDWASRILYRPWLVFSDGQQPEEKNWLTNLSMNDTGIWPLLVAGVVVSAIQAAAVVYCVQEAATVIDRKLARDSDERKLAQTQATALKAVEVHTEREKSAGKTLPLSDALKSLLDGLNRMCEKLAALSDKTPMPEPVLPSFGGSSGNLSWSLIVLAALGVAALYYLSKTNNQKSYRLVSD
jgi:hypothetical protein